MFTIESLRSYKILDYAVFDLAASFIGIYLLSPVLSSLFRLIKLEIPRSSWLYLTLPLGVLIHILVGSYTPMTKYILDPSGHYLLKILLLALTILGVRGMSVIK